MGRKRTPGLTQRAGIWHIDKQVKGYGRLCDSTGTGDLEEAERYLARKLEQIRQATVYGVRPRRTFRQAATEYLETQLHKRSIGRDAQDLKVLVEYIGDVFLDRLHDGTPELQRYLKDRQEAGRAAGGINRALAVVRRILNLAARAWRDEFGMTWLETSPLIPDVKGPVREPYPLDWDEQRLLLRHQPDHLAEMSLFKVNTGAREMEVALLDWRWEVSIPELGRSVFVVPSVFGGRHDEAGVKNGKPRVIVLNDVAWSIVERQRGKHPTRVFTWNGAHGTEATRPVTRMYNTAWKRSRKDAAKVYEEEIGRPCPEGFRRLRVHDLKHTFGRRLRAAGVNHADQQDLLGHTNGSITTHYSAAEIGHLVEQANRVVATDGKKGPTLTLLRLTERLAPAKVPQKKEAPKTGLASA